MKKITSFLLAAVLLFMLCACGEKFNKTPTGYKDNIQWGMSVNEVAEQLGDLVIKKTGTYIIAEDDELHGISTFARIYGGGDAKYNFNDDGQLYEIEFEIESVLINHEDFEEIVDIYDHYCENEIEIGETSRNDIGDSGAYSEFNTAYCDIDEYTELSIMIIKHNGIFDDKGILSVSYMHKELFSEVLLSD